MYLNVLIGRYERKNLPLVLDFVVEINDIVPLKMVDIVSNPNMDENKV